MLVYREETSREEQLLILALKGTRSETENEEIRSLYEEVGSEQAWECAGRNKVQSIVAHALVDLVGDQVEPRWREIHDATFRKNSAVLTELDRVSLLLVKQGLKMAAIESGGIVTSLNACPGCFVSNDVEILITHDLLDEFDRILSSEGFVRTNRGGRAADEPTRSDCAHRGWWVYKRELEHGIVFWLNLMWQPVLRRWYPLHGEPCVSQLLQRAIPVNGRETGLMMLAPEDFLLSCALHTASHTYVREPGLRLHLDVHRIVSWTQVDWEQLLTACQHLEVSSLVFPSLAIPRGLFGTPIPDWVLCRLVPSASKREAILRLLSRASVFQRSRAKFGKFRFFWFETLLCDHGRAMAVKRCLLPSKEWMKNGYAFTHTGGLWLCYLRRLIQLVRKPPV